MEAAPWSFLRGCIYSDGCAFINRTGPYSYVTYYFGNRSADIRGLFTRVCDRVGVDYRTSGPHVRINRRASVALMRREVGLKT